MNRPDREDELIQWEGYRRSLRIKDDRARGIALRLIGEVITWLKRMGPPPSEDSIRAALRCKPNDCLFFGGRALAALALFEPEGDEAALRLFQKASIRACVHILRYVCEHADEQVLTTLLNMALEHRADEVRREAVTRAYWHDLPSFDEFVKRVKRIETDDDIVGLAEEYSEIRRSGFSAKFIHAMWSWDIKYRLDPGPYGPGGITSAYVPKALVDAIGLARAAAHVKAAFPRFVAWDEIVEGV